MDKFSLKPTKITPKVEFDPDKDQLTLEGESYPENSAEFYAPIMEWIEEYLKKKPNFTFIFKMVYFNTSSSKAILDIIDKLDEYCREGGKVQVKWLYQKDDEDIYESGEEFLEDTDLSYELESYE